MEDKDFSLVSYTRGARNNNPANIRRGSHWLGLCKEQSDKDFCQFVSMSYGIRAFLVLCRTYRNKYGISTLREFVHRFAPSNENDTDAYFNYLVKYVPRVLSFEYDYYTLAHYVFRYESRVKIDISSIGMIADRFYISIIPKDLSSPP